MSFPIGTPKSEVRATYGPGLNTGNGFDSRTNTKWEREAYREGDKGIAVEYINEKVSKVENRPNHVPEWTRKLHKGMTMAEVFKTLGNPATGYSPQDHRPDQFWTYSDPIAPIDVLTVNFKGGKVSMITPATNMAMP